MSAKKIFILIIATLLIILLAYLLFFKKSSLGERAVLIDKPTITQLIQPSLTPLITTPPDNQDSDNDGLTDLEEAEYGTNPYLKDTDNDGASDLAEIKTGYNPLINDCIIEAGCTSERISSPKPINVLFILDSSGSMADFVDKETKMTTAKKVLNEYIDTAPPDLNIGLIVYGHKGSNSIADKNLSCSSIDFLYPLGRINKDEFKSKIAAFFPTGWTAIGGSLLKAKNEAFLGKEGENNEIVLISDGIETCDSNPCQVAKDLKESKIKTTINVIGFAVDAQARNQLECLARVTGGKYFQAQTSKQFQESFQEIMGSVQKGLQETICLTKQSLQITNCQSKKDFKIINWSTSNIFKNY